MVHVGDVTIVFAHASYDERELCDHAPRVVHVDANNDIVVVDDAAGVLHDSHLRST